MAAASPVVLPGLHLPEDECALVVGGPGVHGLAAGEQGELHTGSASVTVTCPTLVRVAKLASAASRVGRPSPGVGLLPSSVAPRGEQRTGHQHGQRRPSPPPRSCLHHGPLRYAASAVSESGSGHGRKSGQGRRDAAATSREDGAMTRWSPKVPTSRRPRRRGLHLRRVRLLLGELRGVRPAVGRLRRGRRASRPPRQAGDVSMLRWGERPPRGGVPPRRAPERPHLGHRGAGAAPHPVLAVDLPGHGRSSWRDDGRYDPHTNAEAVPRGGSTLAPERPVVLVGMSLGGLTATRAGRRRPDLVAAVGGRRHHPGGHPGQGQGDPRLHRGTPDGSPRFREIFERTVEFNPTRSHTSLRRGILHNAHRLPDGSWEWNYDRAQPDAGAFPDRGELWSDVAATSMPYHLLPRRRQPGGRRRRRGGAPPAPR